MSTDPDRIAVPTNGRGPHALPGPTAVTGKSATSARSTAADGAPTQEELSTAISPRRLAVGFGIIASLLLLLAGLARRRRPDTDDD